MMAERGARRVRVGVMGFSSRVSNSTHSHPVHRESPQAAGRVSVQGQGMGWLVPLSCPRRFLNTLMHLCPQIRDRIRSPYTERRKSPHRRSQSTAAKDPYLDHLPAGLKFYACYVRYSRTLWNRWHMRRSLFGTLMLFVPFGVDDLNIYGSPSCDSPLTKRGGGWAPGGDMSADSHKHIAICHLNNMIVAGGK